MVRKRIQIDPKKVRLLASICCEPEEAAAALGIPCEVFQASLKADLVVREAWEQGPALARTRLRRNLFKLSETNASVAIFLAKNILGYRDYTPAKSEDLSDEHLRTWVDLVKRVNARQTSKVGNGNNSNLQGSPKRYRH